MSALAGLVAFGGRPVDPSLLQSLLDAQRHRGADVTASFIGAGIGMAHGAQASPGGARAGAQPLTDRVSGCVLVFTGRLDDRQSLHRDLGADAPPAEADDAALVLAGYRRWGKGLPGRLLGDFAFALWDPSRSMLCAARDPVGGANLCFVRRPDYFAFASESEALLALPGVEPGPNENLVACLFVPEFENSGDRRTWLREVEGLLPGEWLEVGKDGSVRIERYETRPLLGDERYASYADCEARFVELFSQAVSDRLRGGGEPAMMLSGGLDSAAIAATLGLAGRPFHAYSAIDDRPGECIESRCIVSLAETTGAHLHSVSVPSLEGMVSAADLVGLARDGAHPVLSSVLLPALMARAAARRGHRVILYGAGGDVVLRTPVHYPALLMRQGRWREAWRECRAAAVHHLVLQCQSPGRIALASLARAAAPAALRRSWRERQLRRRLPGLEGSLISDGLARRIGLAERLAEEFFRDEADSAADPRGYWLRRSVEVLGSSLSSGNLLAGRESIEARDPWADRRVVEFFAQVPDTWKTRQGWTKYPVRSAFQNQLSPLVRDRCDKAHLGWKFNIRFLRESEGYLAGEWERDLQRLEPWCDLLTLRDDTRRWREREDPQAADAVFTGLTLYFWLKRLNAL